MSQKTLLSAAALLFFLSLLSPVLSQTASPTPNQGQPRSLEDLERRLLEVDRRLNEAPSNGAVSSGGADSLPSYTDSLRRLDVSLRRLLSLEESKVRLHSEQDRVEAELRNVSTQGLAEKKPYSVELLDTLQAQLDTINQQSEGANLANTAAKTTLDLETAELESLQATRRRLLDSQTATPSDLTVRRDLETIEVAIEAAQAQVDLAQAELEASELELSLTEKETELIKTKLGLVQQSFRFSKSTLDSQLGRLETQRQSITRKLDEQKDVEEISRARLAALLDDDIDDEAQFEEIEARKEWIDTHQRRERLLEELLELNLIRKDLWERRYLAHQGEGVASFDEWVDSARGLLVRLGKNQDLLNTELSQIRAQLSALMDDAENLEADRPPVSQGEELKVQALVARQKALEEALAQEQETEQLARRLLAELRLQKEVAPLSERLGRAWSALLGFWNIELYTLGDSSVTVGKLCVAVLVLILGLGFTGRVTRLISHRFLARLPVRQNVKVNIERSLRYLFILLVFLFALHVVNIPLTIFTFLGGTLAIAVGFGAQNILNNFISGLILMVEQPVRVGDLIQVDQTTGFIEEIGARSTRIRVPTGIHVILPNSKLLENQVVNWTLHDQRLRVKVSVGVAYGSPARKVMELITQAATAQEAVHRSPAPVVTFEEFGDSSLNFSVHFWVTALSPLDRDRVSTEVRLAIDDLFAEHDIVIPFPQRDLNFNSPVPVRLVPDSD